MLLAMAGCDTDITDLAGLDPWDATRCSNDASIAVPDQAIPAILGMSPDRLLLAYGKPFADEHFIVGQPQGVFYGGLGRMPRGREHKDFGKSARALVWTKQDCDLTVFFVRGSLGWSAVASIKSRSGADF